MWMAQASNRILRETMSTKPELTLDGLLAELAALAQISEAEPPVGMVGVCQVFSGWVNGIPSRVRLEADLRDADGTRREGVLEALRSACNQVAHKRGVVITTALVNVDLPATCEPPILAALEASAVEADYNSKRMVSRVYHDSLSLARIAPVAMLFIPCRDGVSHRPDEYASAEWIGGVHALARTLARLTAEGPPVPNGRSLT
jgi:N-carbamoyl-L-amino-acid hydrolase